MTFCTFQGFILLTLLLLLYLTYCYQSYQSLSNFSTSFYTATYSEEHTLIGIAVALDLEIDFSRDLAEKLNISQLIY